MLTFASKEMRSTDDSRHDGGRFEILPGCGLRRGSENLSTVFN